MAEYGRAYAAAMLANAAALAGALTARGLTARPLAAAHSHLLIVDVAGGDAAALALGRALLDAGLRVNVRKARGRTALRLGVQEITRIGMSPCDMERLADLMAAAGRAADPVAWRPETAALAAEFSVVRYSFDPGADDGGADTSRQAAAAPAGQFADVS
jgi:glycine/serine hydroxymethyltransferase